MRTTAMCVRNMTVRQPLMAALVLLLFATQAQALPFRFACITGGSLAPSIECRLASDGRPSDGGDILATTGGSPFFGSIANLPSVFEIRAGEPQQILFSLTIHASELEVIASLRNDTLRVGTRETIPDQDASYELAGHDPIDPSAALVLIGSGIAGVGATNRRRRGQRRLFEVQPLSTSRKEASSRTPRAPSLFAQGSSHSTPLRI
jgi:hypothetical protein